MAEGILVARDLTPAETAGLDLDLVTGVVLAQGSPTSHAAILARARDIPLVVAAGRDVLSVPEGHDDRPRRQHRRAAHRSRRRSCWTSSAGGPTSLAERRARAARARRAAGRVPGRDARSPSPPTSARWPTPGPRSRPAPTAPAWCAPSSSSSAGRRAPDVDEQQAEYDAIAAGTGRPADHAAHPRRRRRQAAALPADAGRGEPVPRAARDPAQPRAPRPAARPAGGDLPDRAAIPDQRHVPDGRDARRAARGPPGARRGGRTDRAARRVCGSA